MEAFEVALKTALREADPLLECEVLGSYRRRASFSSDIDLVVRHKSFITKDDEETAAPLMRRIVEALDGEHLLDDENRLMYGSKKYAVAMLHLSGHMELTPFLCRDWLAYPATSIIAESTFVSLPIIHTRTSF
jgi:DNA polymerase/3'-5' exonuclease PolX